MSDKVKRYLLLDGIGIAINTFIALILYNSCSAISYDFIAITFKTLIIILSSLLNIIIALFFLLYWWSDIKWSQCKQKARKIKQKFLQ